MTDFDPTQHRMVPEQRWFDDFRLGERFLLPSRTMTEAVFLAFQAASGDNHPVHYDVEYCRSRGMPGLLAHGLQTLAQTAPLTGAVIVSTPQDVALSVAKKAVFLFQQVKVPILGFIENMSSFVCGHCGERTDIFSHGGGERAAEKLGIPFLGRIPIDPAIRDGGDSGHPIVVGNPASPQAAAFREIAQKIIVALGGEEQRGSSIDSLLKKIKQPFTNS